MPGLAFEAYSPLNRSDRPSPGCQQEEALSVRAALLAAEHDVTELLLEAADLEAQGLITAEELAQMKAKWLASV